MKVEIVTIGDELLLGFTVDTNAAHLGRELAAAGIEVTRRTTVGDRSVEIADAVQRALDRTGAVITTGGLGPTSDDLTVAAIAAHFGRTLSLDESLVQGMKARWARLRRTGPFPESNLSQAMIPEGADVLPNGNGTAPGIMLEDARGRWVAMLPGVPREMRSMLSEQLVPRLIQRLAAGPPAVIRSRTVRTTGMAESALADVVTQAELDLAGLELAYLPGVHSVDLRLTARGVTPDRAAELLEAGVLKLRGAVGRYVYGLDDEDLAAVALDACRQENLRLAVAESCTGGMLGERLTAVPGSSDVFLGGVIAYDDAAKQELLGVDATELARSGAVSEPVARAMARSVRERLRADIGIAVTGIAGPDGGSEEKPVGTVWLCLDWKTAEARCLRLFGNREEVRQRASQAALDMLRRAVLRT